MKRTWNFIESVFDWNKKQKKEEEEKNMMEEEENIMEEEKMIDRIDRILYNKGATVLGILVNDSYDYDLLWHWYYTDNRGPQYSCYTIFTLPEFRDYYRKTGIVEFLDGIENAWEEENPTKRSRYFENAFRNEIMFYLMKEHGVTYNAAFNFTQFVIISGWPYDFIDLKGTLGEISDIFRGNPACNILYDRILYLYNLAHMKSKAAGHVF